jgi:hypothetical protein
MNMYVFWVCMVANIVCAVILVRSILSMRRTTKELKETTARMRASTDAHKVKFENGGIIYYATITGKDEATNKFIEALDTSRDFTRVEE